MSARRPQSLHTSSPLDRDPPTTLPPRGGSHRLGQVSVGVHVRGTAAVLGVVGSSGLSVCVQLRTRLPRSVHADRLWPLLTLPAGCGPDAGVERALRHAGADGGWGLLLRGVVMVAGCAGAGACGGDGHRSWAIQLFRLARLLGPGAWSTPPSSSHSTSNPARLSYRSTATRGEGRAQRGRGRGSDKKARRDGWSARGPSPNRHTRPQPSGTGRRAAGDR